MCAACLSEYRTTNNSNNNNAACVPPQFHPVDAYILPLALCLYCSKEHLTALLRRSLPPTEIDSMSHIVVKCGRDLVSVNVLAAVGAIDIDCKIRVDVRSPEANSFPVKVRRVLAK
jgi:hypothetical protein